MREALETIPRKKAASFTDNAALEDHLKRRHKQMEFDRNALEVMRKGLDVPFSHTQVKNRQGTA